MSSHFRGRKSCPRRTHLLLLLVLSPVVIFLFVFHRPEAPASRDRDAIPHIAALRLADALLDDALHVSLSFSAQNHQDGRPRAPLRGAYSDAYPSPSSSLDALRAQLCQVLNGRSIFLVGPHESLYQLHLFLLAVLQPDPPIPGSTMVLTRHASCPARPSLSSSCPSHPLCHPIIKLPSPSSSDSGSGLGPDTRYGTYGYGYEPLGPVDVKVPSTKNSSSSFLRYFHSGNLNPSPTQEDVRPSVPSVDPRTGVRVIDSRWVRYAASSKANILVLNRGPLPAPAWSYNNNNEHSNASFAARNLTWLSALRALEQEHAEPLSDLFADVLSRLDHAHAHDLLSETDTKTLLISAALHSTISTFLPSLLSTLSKLRKHAGHRAILGGEKPVLWYGSWFLPVSCVPDSLSVFSSSESNPRHLLVRLLVQAEAMDNPWSAYNNAQGLYD